MGSNLGSGRNCPRLRSSSVHEWYPWARLPQLLQVCVNLDELNAENISLLVILCIIVYVTNKAHLKACVPVAQWLGHCDMRAISLTCDSQHQLCRLKVCSAWSGAAQNDQFRSIGYQKSFTPPLISHEATGEEKMWSVYDIKELFESIRIHLLSYRSPGTFIQYLHGYYFLLYHSADVFLFCFLSTTSIFLSLHSAKSVLSTERSLLHIMSKCPLLLIGYKSVLVLGPENYIPHL